MIKKKIVIPNKLGLHARAAAKFVAVAAGFESTVEIAKDAKVVNGKSIMSVLLLAASQGTELTLNINGQDEEEALAALENLINNRFDEPE